DYVIMGDVKLWRLKDPGAINLLRGTSVVQISVYETPKASLKGEKPTAEKPLPKKGRIIKTVEATGLYPKEYGMNDVGFSNVEHNEEYVDNGLKAVTARSVGELFYAHKREEARLGE